MAESSGLRGDIPGSSRLRSPRAPPQSPNFRVSLRGINRSAPTSLSAASGSSQRFGQPRVIHPSHPPVHPPVHHFTSIQRVASLTEGAAHVPRVLLPARRLLKEETTEPSLTSMHEFLLLHRLPHYLQHHIVPGASEDSEQFVIPVRIVKDFIDKLCQPCQFSIQTLIYAICLVRRAGLFRSSFNEATWQIRLLTAVSLTNKMHDDIPLKDSELLKQFPMLLSSWHSLVDCEVMMAVQLDWRIQVDVEVFEGLCNEVLTLPLEVPILLELLHLDSVRLPELSNRTLQTLEGAVGTALDKVHAEQRRRHKQANEESSCCICLEKRRSVVLQPCRHLVLCNVCADLHKDLRQPCPQCRALVEAYLHVYAC